MSAHMPKAPDTGKLAAGEQKLELDREWERDRGKRKPEPSDGARRLMAEASRARPAARIPWLGLLAILVALGGGAYYVFTLDKAPATPPPAANSVPARGVAIRIVGAPGTPVTIDGAPAGKTPLSLKRSANKRAILIQAGGKTFQVVPDRDHTIDVTSAP